jgi:hypothetical protein
LPLHTLLATEAVEQADKSVQKLVIDNANILNVWVNAVRTLLMKVLDHKRAERAPLMREFLQCTPLAQALLTVLALAPARSEQQIPACLLSTTGL